MQWGMVFGGNEYTLNEYTHCYHREGGCGVNQREQVFPLVCSPGLSCKSRLLMLIASWGGNQPNLGTVVALQASDWATSVLYRAQNLDLVKSYQITSKVSSSWDLGSLTLWPHGCSPPLWTTADCSFSVCIITRERRILHRKSRDPVALKMLPNSDSHHHDNWPCWLGLIGAEVRATISPFLLLSGMGKHDTFVNCCS